MGIILTLFQIGLFLFLFIMSNLFTLLSSFLLMPFLSVGLALIVWAAIVLGLPSLSPLPTPRKNNVLKISGPYKFIRHPFYSGLILIACCMFLTRPYWIPLLTLLVFILVVNKKADLEEKLLQKKYPKYKEYSRKTGKYLPFIF